MILYICPCHYNYVESARRNSYPYIDIECGIIMLVDNTYKLYSKIQNAFLSRENIVLIAFIFFRDQFYFLKTLFILVIHFELTRNIYI